MHRRPLVRTRIVLGSASCAALLGMAASAAAQTASSSASEPLESLPPETASLASAELERGAPGALIEVTLDSKVGVVLDEIPLNQRAAAASYYIAKGGQFWKDRAFAQAQNTSYRLVYRQFFYNGNKAMLALPPKELWKVELKPGGAKRVTTGDGHDAVVIGYTLRTTLLSDAETPGQSEPALRRIGGVWEEPFNFPLDPEFVFQRTGYACIDEDGYPLRSTDSENYSQFFDQDCDVETPDESVCHHTEFPDVSCKQALRRHTGRVDTNLRFERVRYDAAKANAVRIAEYTQTSDPDLAVLGENLETNRIVYRYIEPDSCAVQEACVTGSGWRRLLLYDASIENASPVALTVGPASDESPFVQRNVFEFSACHQHFHYSHYGNFSYGNLPGDKRAFCVESTDRYFNSEETPLAHPFGCDNQGIASGWGDTYIAGIECNWIDITNLEFPEDTLSQSLEFALNPDGFICEGTPEVDATGAQVFTPTEEIGENGGMVEKPSCEFVEGYAANNLATQTVTVPSDGGFITAPCTREQAGPLRDCGFVEVAENLPCEPGGSVTLSCTLDAGMPPQVLRVCENSTELGGVTACMFIDALATGVVIDSAPAVVTFTCPAARSDVETGGYGYFTGSLLPNEPPLPITCAVVAG